MQAWTPWQLAPDASGLEQVPVAESHVPGTWQLSLAVQVTGLPPVHTPLRHVSV
jgi:hypothetical protein